MAMAAIGAMALPKYAPKSFSIWGAQIKHVGVGPCGSPLRRTEHNSTYC